jgi:hypothetical protein
MPYDASTPIQDEARAIRLVSSQKSVERGTVSALALLECLASVIVYLAIAISLETLLFYSIAVCFAPLFLFRTPDSVETGLDIYESILKFWGKLFDDLPSYLSEPLAVIYCLLLPVFGFSARFLATSWHLIRHPMNSLQAMPGNWFRQSLCTDFARPPEMVPNEEQVVTNHAAPTFDLMLRRVLDRGNNPLMRAIGGIVLCIAYVPPILLRVSFKATSPVYAPFVWAVDLTLKNQYPLKYRLERITKGELEKVRRVFSLSVLGMFVVKASFLLGVLTYGEVVEKLPKGLVSQVDVLVRTWPIWQVSVLFDALLTYALFFFADAALAQHDLPNRQNEQKRALHLSIAQFARAAVAIAAILYLLLYSAANIVLSVQGAGSLSGATFTPQTNAP